MVQRAGNAKPLNTPRPAEIADFAGSIDSLRHIALLACNRLSNILIFAVLFQASTLIASDGMAKHESLVIFQQGFGGGAPERIKVGTGELKSYCHKEVLLLLFEAKAEVFGGSLDVRFMRIS